MDLLTDPDIPDYGDGFDLGRHSSLGSDEELVKVGEIELKDPFHNVENEEGIKIAVRKITKVTTLKRQRSRASSIADPERSGEESKHSDDDNSGATDADDVDGSSSNEDDGDPNVRDGDERVEDDPDKDHEMFTDINTNTDVYTDYKRLAASDTHLAVNRSRDQDRIDVSKEAELVTGSRIVYRSESRRHEGQGDSSFLSSPGSAKRRLSSINNPDYYNHIWKPILGKYKKSEHDDNDVVYWKVVHEKSKADKRMVSKQDERILRQTEDWRHQQDERHHQIYNMTKTNQNEDYPVYGQSTVEENQTDGIELAHCNRFANQDKERNTTFVSRVRETSATREQQQTRAVVEEGSVGRSTAEQNHIREFCQSDSQNDSQNDERQQLVDRWFYEHSNVNNTETLTNRQITEELFTVVNSSYGLDTSTTNISQKSASESRQSALQSVTEQRQNINSLEQNLNVRSVFTERDVPVNEDRSSARDLQRPQTAIIWRDPDLPEVIEYLTHQDDVIKRNAAAYLQHLCYMNEEVKNQIRDLGGIPLLVELLNTDSLDLHQVACGALRNLSYSTVSDETKRAIAHAGGLSSLVRLLHRTKNIRLQEIITAILWNISSVKELKRPLLDEGISVLVSKVLIPHSNWHPDDEILGSDTFRAVYYSVLLRNTTGVLRNVSSDGCHARMKMRQCEGLIESLMVIVQSASGKSDVNNKCVENSVCILRNLTYACQEFVDPDLENKDGEKNTVNYKKRNSSTCFGSKKKSPTKDEPPEVIKHQINISEDKRLSLLWSSTAASLYLSVLYDCSNPVTIEAAAGAIQNLCSCDWQLSEDIRENVRKQKGLPVFVELLTSGSDPVLRTTAAALRNLVINDKNRELVGKHAITELIECLPKPSDSRQFTLSNKSLFTVLTLIYSVIERNTEASRRMTTDGGIDALMYIVRNDRFDYRSRKYASMILTTMWRCPELRDLYIKRGWTEEDFLVTPIHPQKVKSQKSFKKKKSKKNQSNDRKHPTGETTMKQGVNVGATDTCHMSNVSSQSNSVPARFSSDQPNDSRWISERTVTSGDNYQMNHLSSEENNTLQMDQVTQRRYSNTIYTDRFDPETGTDREPFIQGNHVSRQESIYNKVNKTSYANQAFVVDHNLTANGKDANSWV